ncbi:TPA: terminase small subunit [Pseudomonas aeruginosa]|nr:terminase small subunit [Pseudomonas aeruginosa]
MALTNKQRRFVEEYLVDLNATQAAIRAGYSERRASEIGSQSLRKPEVAAAIQEAMQARASRTEIDADYVLRRMVEIDQMDVLDILSDSMELKPVSQWPRVWRQYLSGFDLAEMFEGRGDDRAIVGVLKKIKWPDKVKNLELLGRHFGMFTDNLAVGGKGGGPIPVVSIQTNDPQEAAKIYQKLMNP